MWSTICFLYSFLPLILKINLLDKKEVHSACVNKELPVCYCHFTNYSIHFNHNMELSLLILYVLLTCTVHSTVTFQQQDQEDELSLFNARDNEWQCRKLQNREFAAMNLLFALESHLSFLLFTGNKTIIYS